jgi:DNA-binding beta-propeller fold protein YncE
VTFKPVAAAALAAVLLGAARRPPPLIVYSAPAGERPAGADAVRPPNAILPDGRIAAPAGVSVFVGTNPLGMALSPDGRFVVVSNDDQRTGGLSIPNVQPAPAIGYSLSVVDAASMKLVSVYRDPTATFFMGVAALRDPANPSQTIVLASDGANGVVRVFDLSANGTLAPETQTIALPATGVLHAFPSGISIAPDGRTAYVADSFGNTLISIDVASRTAQHAFAVGDAPFFTAASSRQVLATGSGLSAYASLGQPVRAPQFAAPAFDPNRASALSAIDLAPSDGAAADPATVRMDPAPDGTQDIGGAAPGAIAITRNGKAAYVALSNVDRVAVVSLSAEPRVVRGLDLRLYPNAPYGAEPSALALSRDGKRLYVALAGLNAVAVLDARTPKRYRYGLIPTGWYPTALAMSSNGRYLYVLDAKGVDGWGMLQRVDLKHTSLIKATMDTLRFNRTAGVAKFDSVVPPLRSNKRSSAIDRVVYVAVGTQAYDTMLGDLKDASGTPHGNGNPAFAQDGESITPNLHALARTYALSDNFYAADSNLDLARHFATAGDASLIAQLTVPVSSARAPLSGRGDDPEDYTRAGTIFNALARAGLSYRDYGGLLELSGYNDASYHFDVPAAAVLAGNVDLNYAPFDPKIDDAHRAQEFVRDMQRYVTADAMPAFSYVWLPTAARQGGAAEADRALGTIVDFLSHTPHWSSTAIFVVPEGVDGGADHVNPMRSYALVVSPLARRGYIGAAHLSASSVLKTEEEIFGLQPLALGDLLATDMADFFTDAPAPETYQAIR